MHAITEDIKATEKIPLYSINKICFFPSSSAQIIDNPIWVLQAFAEFGSSYFILHFTATRTAPTLKASLHGHHNIPQRPEGFSLTHHNRLHSSVETSYLVDAVTLLESEILPVTSRCTTAGRSMGFSVPSSGSSSDCSSFISSSSSKRSFICTKIYSQLMTCKFLLRAPGN